MNEEQVQALFDALDAALESVPLEARPDINDLFAQTVRDSVAAHNRADKVELELEKAAGPAPLTKEKVMSETDPNKRMQLIRENPELFGPNAVKPKQEFTSKAEIMAIRNGFERHKAIVENPHLFEANSPQRQEYREDRSNDLQNTFQS